MHRFKDCRSYCKGKNLKANHNRLQHLRQRETKNEEFNDAFPCIPDKGAVFPTQRGWRHGVLLRFARGHLRDVRRCRDWLPARSPVGCEH